jgi:oligopeptide transport system substrate-binding protein
LDDANVRRALALAVDRQGLNDLFAEGMELVGHTILPPAMPGYSVNLEESWQEEGYDPQAAVAALDASAYADGLPEITIIASGYGDEENDFINALVSGWDEVLGVTVAVEFVDPQNYSEAARESGGQLVSYGWCADYPDPQNFLEVLYHSDSEFNVAGYSNEDIDALLEAAAIELDGALRLEQYETIEALLLADYAAIPIWHGDADVLVNPRIKGYVLSPINDSPVSTLSIEQKSDS